MPSELALIPITAALKALMVAHTPLTSLIASKTVGAGGGPAIYDEGSVAQGAPMPYVVMGAGTQIPFHGMGGTFGWNCTLQIKAVRQGNEQTGEATVGLIMSRIVGLLYHGRTITVTGYGSAWCDEFTVQPTIVTVVAGVVTREVPGILRVFVHDT